MEQTLLQDSIQCEPSKKRAHVFPIVVFGFFSTTSSKQMMQPKWVVLEDLMLFVVKGFFPMKTVELI